MEERYTYEMPSQTATAVVEKENSAESLHFILKDHLGSWTTITDSEGNVEQELSFDAWGNRRNAATWTGTATGSLLFDRGFTGHEHIESIGLINMNGRLYDPVMSTFLSVDNYVQEPDFSQNFNRYAYCLNNPLKYVDPDGESILASLVIYAAIGAAVSMVSTVATNVVYDRPLYEGLGKAAAMGALQGMFSFGIGTAAGIIGNAIGGTWGTVAQTGFQVLAHGTLGGISSEVREGKFWSGFASGAVASFVASTTGIMTNKLPKAWQVTCMVAAGGLSGGVTATMAGGYFWDGVCNGLICSGLNHAMHLVVEPVDPPGSKKNNAQQIKERAQNAPTIVGAEATIVEKAAKLTWLMEGESAGLTKIMNVTSKVSRAGLIINTVINAERAYNGELSWQSFTMRTIVSSVEYGCFKIPHIAATMAGAGLLYYDFTGGFENTLYNDAWLHENISPYVTLIQQYLKPNYSEYGQTPIYYRHGK